MTARLVPPLLWLLAILFVAVLVHLGSILALPWHASRDGHAGRSDEGAAGAIVALPPASSGLAPPFTDPALSSASCRYDLALGPWRISAAAGEAEFFAVSFRSRSGVPFYALTDRSSIEGRIDVLLTTPEQLELFEAAEGDEPAHDLRIVAPQTEGVVQFDVMARVGGAAAAEAMLKSMSCKVEASP